MSYVNPIFIYLHALRDGTVTVRNEATDFPKERLFDDLIGPLFKFSTSATNHWVAVDQGAVATGVNIINQLVIGKGHNIGGVTIQMEESTTGAWAAEETNMGGSFVVDAGTGSYRKGLTAATKRYVRMRITTSGQWELSEVYFSHANTPTRGPTQRWTQGFEPNVVLSELRSGVVYGVSRGDTKQVWEISHVLMTDADRDMVTKTLLDATRQGAAPWWYISPDSGFPLVLVELDGPIRIEQDTQVPKADGPRWRVSMRMVEAVG